jgi:hypothetical protein
MAACAAPKLKTIAGTIAAVMIGFRIFASFFLSSTR